MALTTFGMCNGHVWWPATILDTSEQNISIRADSSTVLVGGVPPSPEGLSQSSGSLKCPLLS